MADHSHTHDDGQCCGHDHDHAHGHHHHHHDHEHGDDTYFIDQLCMVGLSGFFGVICLCLYFWKQQMLTLLLGPQFHLFVLGSGVALLLLAVVRGVSLWTQAAPARHEHDHHHDHGAEGHAHAHGHHHHHDHSAEDHDHGWAPWRYVVLLVPVILFMLGLPNKGPEVQGKEVDIKVDTTQEAMGYAGMVALGPSPLAMISEVAVLFRDRAEGPAQPIDFKSLEGAAASAERREYFKGKIIEVRGQFSPSPSNNHVFSLVRFRISCCAADAIPLDVPIICREEIRNVAKSSWVKVTGKVDFAERNGAYTAVVLVPSRAKIEACSPDLNPWVQ